MYFLCVARFTSSFQEGKMDMVTSNLDDCNIVTLTYMLYPNLRSKDVVLVAKKRRCIVVSPIMSKCLFPVFHVPSIQLREANLVLIRTLSPLH